MKKDRLKEISLRIKEKEAYEEVLERMHEMTDLRESEDVDIGMKLYTLPDNPADILQNYITGSSNEINFLLVGDDLVYEVMTVLTNIFELRLEKVERKLKKLMGD